MNLDSCAVPRLLQYGAIHPDPTPIIVYFIASSGSSTVNHRFLLIAACTHSTFWGLLPVVGLLNWRLISRDTRQSLKCRYQNFILASLIQSYVKGYLIIRTVSADEFTNNRLTHICSVMQRLQDIYELVQGCVTAD